MYANKMNSGRNIPYDINVIIEIPAHSDPVKYEVEKDIECLCVSRFMPTAMRYPCNYGYIPRTLAADNDPLDVLVLTPFPLFSGSMIRCRPIGVLKMTDESGEDHKLLAVPNDDLTDRYHDIKSFADLPRTLLHGIRHFFEHYKDLEPNKWVKVDKWYGPGAAHDEVLKSVENFKKNKF